MKKIIWIIIVAIVVFICFIKFFISLFDSTIYSIVGSITDATLDEDNNIVILKEDITEQPTYINYVYQGVTIGLLAIKNSEGRVIVVVNTCKSCEYPSNAYYLLKGKKLLCQSCNKKIEIDELDSTNDDECYPIKIEERIDENDKIIIGTKQLNELKDRFTKWNGPK